IYANRSKSPRFRTACFADHDETSYFPRQAPSHQPNAARNPPLRFLLWGRPTIQLDIPLDPHLLDQVELSVEEVDMLFLIVENPPQQVARDIITHRLTIGDAFTQVVHR